jgi:2,4-dienoyl-CoA reductase-like NADH-dependent reductase (Old Yellow Enzyme family)
MDSAGSNVLTKDPLLQPLTIKKLTLRNRIMSTSHACGLEVGGMPQEAYQRYHEEKARGGLALSMFGGSSNIDRDSPNSFRQLNVGSDEIIPHLQRFSVRMHRLGAALMCQITHLGRRGDPYAGDWLATIGPSPVRETLHRSIPKEMDEHDINRVVQAYARAALRCKEGGLDGAALIVGGLTLVCGSLGFLLFRRDEPPISQESFEQDLPRHEHHLGERRGAREAEQNGRPRALSL